MRIRILVCGLAALLALPAAPLLAEQQNGSRTEPAHVADAAALRRALAERRAQDDANRETIREAMQRDDVRGVAARLGLDVRRANDALATLDSRDLARAAAPARALLDASGEASTITISITTLLLVLILIVLIVK